MLYRAATRPAVDDRHAGLRESLEKSLQRLTGAHRVPGAQLAVSLDGVTHTVETGEVLTGSGEPFTADTAVPIGSVTKSFTAVLAMLLVADGDVGLDEPLRGHLPELRGLGAPLTLRQVLSHTGGLPTGPDSGAVTGLTARRYVEKHVTDHLQVMPPGTGFSYSNAGYVVAGQLVEAVTAMPWDEAVRSMVLGPLGIRPAFLGDPAGGRAAATGHSVHPDTGRVRPVRQLLAPAEAAAGALLASARDLLALGRAHLDAAGRPSPVLPEPLLTLEMRRAVPQADPCGIADGWAPGFALFDCGGTTWFGHDGNAMGTACHLRADPVSGTVVAFTANAGNGTQLWHDVCDELGGILGLPVPGGASWEPAAPVAPPAGCTGTYLNGDIEYLVATADDALLTVSVDGDLPTPLVCYADLRCALVDPESGRLLPAGRFLTDPDTGAVDRLLLTGRMGRRTG